MVLRGVARYVLLNADRVVASRFLDVASFGYVTISRELSNAATGEIAVPVGKAFAPGFSRFQDDLKRFEDAFWRTVSGISLMVLPAAFGLAAAADELVYVLLGSKWSELGEILPVFALASGVFFAHSFAGNILVIRKRVKLVVLLAWLRAIVMIACVYIGYTELGVIGVAWGAVWGGVFSFVVLFAAVIYELKSPVWRLPVAIGRPALASIVMWLAITSVSPYLSGVSLADLLVKVVFGGLVYLAVLFVIWRVSGKPKTVEYETFCFFLTSMRKVTRAFSARGVKQ